MASVPLSFSPPESPTITALHIEEAPASDGPWAEIEAVEEVGTYPEYIRQHTTNDATSAINWFRIRWLDTGGAFTPYSAPMQGGTGTIVSRVIDRVLQRDLSLNDAAVAQEAEAAVQSFFGVDNPYDPTLTATYSELNGLTYLVMARTMIVEQLRSQRVSSATIGLVSMRSGDISTSIKNIEALIDMANNLLGLTFSLVMLMEEVQIGNSIPNAMWRDQSRLMLETEIL